jgi:predicted nucleic acid-binding protein
MYLVDTSVWIDFIRGKQTPAVDYLRGILEAGNAVGISSVIYQEILQGSESEQRLEQFRLYFSGLPFYHSRHPIDSYVQAARIYFNCRRAGITIRSTIDCLIARIAIEHDLVLLHSDKDFWRIAQITPDLKVFAPGE